MQQQARPQPAAAWSPVWLQTGRFLQEEAELYEHAAEHFNLPITESFPRRFIPQDRCYYVQNPYTSIQSSIVIRRMQLSLKGINKWIGQWNYLLFIWKMCEGNSMFLYSLQWCLRKIL